MAIDNDAPEQIPSDPKNEEESRYDSWAFASHFDKLTLREAMDVGKEANRLMGELLGETFEEPSPPSQLIFAAAEYTEIMTYRNAAEALGLDSDALYTLIYRWHSAKNEDPKTPPIELSALAADVAAMETQFIGDGRGIWDVPPLNLSFHKE